MAKHKIPKTLLPLAKPIDELTPFPGNPRIGNVDEIAKSLKRHGQYAPIVANKRTSHVLRGNHTLQAAQALGWTAIAVTWVSIPAEEEARIVLADNRLADLGRYDDAAILALLEPLSEDLDGIGYDAIDVMAMIEARDEAAIAAGDGITDPGAGEPPAKPKTKPGDVYDLGDHVLVCGDARDPDVHAALMGDDRADLLWTDPPYGVAYVGKTKDALTIENDDLDPEALRAFLDEALRACRLHPGAAVYVAALSGPLVCDFMRVLIELGWMRQTLVWLKSSMVLGRSDYHYKHEHLIYGWTPGASHDWRGGRKQTSILEFDKPGANREHPTMKPVDLIVRCLTNNSAPGAVVLDCFGGSGSTLIAAEETKRRARLIELDPAYCDVIVRRWEGATGQTAKRRKRATR